MWLVSDKLKRTQKQSAGSPRAAEKSSGELTILSMQMQLFKGVVGSLKSQLSKAAKACSDAVGSAEKHVDMRGYSKHVLVS